MNGSPKVAGWYWTVSAALLPFVVLSCLLTGYYMHKADANRREAERIVADLKAGHSRIEGTRQQIRELGEVIGFVDPKFDAFVDEASGEIQASGGMAEEEAKPAQEQDPVYAKYREAEKLFFGTGDGSPGQIQEYMALRKYLDRLDVAVRRYVAFKAYQIYNVETIEIGAAAGGGEGERVAVASGVIERPGAMVKWGELRDELYLPTDAELDAAWADWKSGKAPREESLKAPVRITLELIWRRQNAMLDELASANLKHYGILVSEVSGPAGEGYIGVRGEANRLESAKNRLALINNVVKTRRDQTLNIVEDVKAVDVEIAELAASRVTEVFDTRMLVHTSRLLSQANAWKQEKDMHENDAEAFRTLASNIPRIKAQTKLQKLDPDGQVTMASDRRKTVHIDLGRMDGVVAGQRFEVWRFHGRDEDKFIGMVEIVRTLSDYYSLCTVLELADENEPIRKGDEIVSRLWHDGEFLTIALHGSFEPPKEMYTKERLTELLRQAGCRVVEKLQPGTDIVITGSSLTRDEWYRNARDDIRVETLKEDDVRLYVDPR